MCGILGFVTNTVENRLDLAKKMLERQNHRGPDASGLFSNENCILGHNRLSIIDLTQGGQPMLSIDERYIVVFNGEIYGYKRIKNDLEYPFSTNSDTEVVLALYIKYGDKCVEYLTGMFSFAIWDDHKKRLFCARDRVGEKPFYYGVTSENEFVFSSEVDVLASSGVFDLSLDSASIGHFFRKLYIHPSHSIYSEIKSLPPGCYGIFEGGKFTFHRYWGVDSHKTELGYMEAVEQLEYLLRCSVEDQLVADVPVSVFLSGGLDSSTIAAYAAKINPSIQALTYRFRSGLDEGRFAKDLAEKHGIEMFELWEPNNNNFLDLLIRCLHCYGEPFADSSAIPTMLICEQASKQTKVVLSGDGADELFGGYFDRYRVGVYQSRYEKENKARVFAERYLYALLNKVRSSRNYYLRSVAARNVLGCKSLVEFSDAWYGLYVDEELSNFGFDVHESIFPENKSTVNDVMNLDILNYLPGDILVKTDRASMAVGLEVRSPFLSKEIVEFAIGLPDDFKVSTQSSKIIMRDSFGGEWTKSISNRSKQGFGFPISNWLKDASVDEYRRYVLRKNSKCYDYLNSNFVEKYKTDDGMFGWSLFIFAAWLEEVCKI